MSVTQTDVLLKLSYLLGESSIPTGGAELEQRKSFIQSTLEEIYRVHPFDLNRVSATVAVVGGVASLPSGVAGDSILDVRYVLAGNDHIYSPITYAQQDDFIQGNYRYWLTGAEGSLVLNTRETDATLQINYQTTAPIINGSVSTPFPDPMIIALGALRYVRQSQNPFADIIVEEEQFRARLNEFISQYNRNVPRRLFRTAQDIAGKHTGDI